MVGEGLKDCKCQQRKKIRTNYVTYGQIMSLMDKLCHLWTNYTGELHTVETVIHIDHFEQDTNTNPTTTTQVEYDETVVPTVLIDAAERLHEYPQQAATTDVPTGQPFDDETEDDETVVIDHFEDDDRKQAAVTTDAPIAASDAASVVVDVIEAAEGLPHDHWRFWVVPSHPGKLFVRYKCPYCCQKSVYIPYNIYPDILAMNELPPQLTLDKDGRICHRDEYMIPSQPSGTAGKMVVTKRMAMRSHHKKHHPDKVIPKAYENCVKDPVTVTTSKQPPNGKRERAAQKRQERRLRKHNNEMTEADRIYYEKKAAAAHIIMFCSTNRKVMNDQGENR